MRRTFVVALVIVVTAGCLEPTALARQGVSRNTGGGVRVTLSFTVPPSSAIAGFIITPAVQVMARDTLGRQDSSFTGNVTVAIGTNPVGASLGGTRTVAAVAGLASFGDLTISRPGTGYTLVASTVGASGATSPPFSVTAPDQVAPR